MLAAITSPHAFFSPYAEGGGQTFSPRSENPAAAPGEAKTQARAEDAEPTERAEENPAGRAPGAAQKPNGETLSAEEAREVAELSVMDRKVRQHEMAHVAAGGELVTSGARYEYQEGPDGKRYAVAGEVGIDTSEGRTPEETVARARRIRAAALAPADPSPQDRSVAAAATQMEIRAQQEIAQNRQAEQERAATENTAAAPAVRAYRDMTAANEQARFSAYA
jgi:hypothetical protein